MTASDIKTIHPGDKDYPESLSVLADMPETLYYAGDPGLMRTSCIAVVGTRNMTRYGADVTRDFVEGMVRSGATIVSGMAEGVDTVAHKTALAGGGRTIAVMGCGLGHIYPAHNRGLFHELAEKGLILSEYEPGVPPMRHQFPRRNRIISALSEATLVTEAGEKSGALITAYDALDQGREVFAVPGSIYSARSIGTNRLLARGHAHVVTNAADIFRILGKHYIKDEKVSALQLDMEQEKVLNILIVGGRMHMDTLTERTGLSAQQLSHILFNMELLGIVRRESGNYYSAPGV